MRKLRFKILSAVAAIAICFCFSILLPLITAAISIIDDQFADGISTNQNLPANSLAVLKSRSGTTRTDAVGSVEYDLTGTGTSADAYFAYFTNSGSPVGLSVGDSLSFSGTFSLQGFANLSNSDIRFGLLNSNGSRRTTDLTGGNSAPEFGDDTGYASQFFTNAPGSSPITLYRRDVVSPTPITNIFNSFTNAGFTVISGTGATTRQALENNVPYTLTYLIERLTATQTRLTVTVTGGTLTGMSFTSTETSATPYTSFDWFDFRIAGTNFAQKVKFTRIKVDYNPAVPVISAQPIPPVQTVSAGSNVQYSVGATGIQLSYQWLKDNNPIQGNASATTSTLQLNNVLPADAGQYKVVVSNPGGSVTSDPVTLNVNTGPVDPPPVINQQPVNTTAVIGTPASLSVVATGLNLSYQWFKNGSPIAGATGPTLNFSPVQLSDAADYTVNVFNGGGTIPSDTAHLTVVSTMSISSRLPANGSNGICVDTPFSITFDQVPKIGASGQIRLYTGGGVLIDTIDMTSSPQTKNIGGTSFRYLPVIINGNTALITPHVQLAYGQTYYLTMEPGVLTDSADVPFVGITGTSAFTFTTRGAAPQNTGIISVNADGSGNFCTIQGAVDFVPAGNSQRVVINVKNGSYTEIVNVPGNKPFITIRGENRSNTVQKYPNNNNLNPSTNTRPSFNVNTGASDFTLESITLQNSTPQGGSQAEAFRTNGQRTTLNSVNLLSYQDTLLTQASTYVTNSYIEGDVDFMWGTGATYFNNTELKALREGLGYYTQIRNGLGNNGNVYVNCRFTKGAGVTNGIYLGRIDPDDFPFSQVVLIDSKMDSHVIPAGWLFNNPTNTVDPTNYPNIRYWEYNSTALDGVTPIDCSQRHPIARNACNNPLSVTEANFYRDPVNTVGFTPQEKLTATVVLSNLSQTYDGTPKPVTVTSDPGTVTVNVTYNGSAAAPTNAGTYAVVATVNDANYQGSANGTLTIAQASAAVSLSNLIQNYDGTPKSANIDTTPAGLTVAATYNGSASPPSAVGNYLLSVNVTDPNYVGSASGIFTIKSTVKAFPTAEGSGAYTIGGRGGDTYHVTNLNDLGPGSLRQGIISATGSRMIVFDVSGTIFLNSRLTINKSFLTLAGQTAPGDGITIAGWTTLVTDAQHIIIRYMRFRPGDIRCGSGMEGDSLSVDRSRDVIIDHVSASWSIDESLSVTESDRVTVQWSFINESLNNSCHPEGRHGFGSLIRYGDGRISYHHNFYSHHFNRNPRIGDNLTLDFVNNVIYDWGTDASYSGTPDEGITKVNYLGNYLVAGPDTPASKRTRAFNGGSVNTWIYQNGNRIDSNFNGIHDGVDTGWSMFVNLYTQQATPLGGQPDVSVEGADVAFNKVLITGGSSRIRDSIDKRLIDEVRRETGLFINSQTEVGGYPALNSASPPVDTDQDGLPDDWENANGENPSDPSDAALIAPNGYSNLENYLNSDAFAPPATNVSLIGRVSAPNGVGIVRTTVTLTNPISGEVRVAVTNQFGYYSFVNVPFDTTYVVSVTNRRYTFANPTRVVNVVDDIGDLNFVGN